MARKLLTQELSEPLNNATAARVEVHVGDGNLTIDRLSGDEPVLANGTLEYLENQDQPRRTLAFQNGQAALSINASRTGQPWFHFPWSACNGATHWQIHLNPNIPADITAHSDGGNIRLDLTGMAVSHLAADTGGGRMDVLLPDHACDLNVTAKSGAGDVSVDLGSDLSGSSIVHAQSGAGNVTVRVPDGVAARIHASTGLGKAIVDPRFSKSDGSTYQSPDFDRAPRKVEITMHSGAGNVIVNNR